MKSKLLFQFIVCSLLVGFQTIAFAQNNGIYVVDSLTKVPVAFASLSQGENIVVSDENGYISLARFPLNDAPSSLRCIGYSSKAIYLSEYDLSKGPVFFLDKKVVAIKEVMVTADGNKNMFSSISNLDIHLRPIANSQEVLRMVPGLFIGQHAGGGKAEQIFLRGFDIDHGTDINITVDGLPVNMVSHAHGQGYADLHFVIPEFIDNVNFNKGPYFAEKGNFTTAGFVEFRTKDYLEDNFAKVEIGQYNTYRSVIGVNLIPNKGEIRKHSLYLGGEGSYSDNFFESPQNFNRFNGTLKYHGKLNAKNALTGTITGFSSKWLASGQIPDRAVERGDIGFYGAIDDTEGGSTSRYNANVELLTQLKNGATLRNQLFYSNYAFELFSNFTFFAVDSINGDQIKQKENRNILGYNSVFQKKYSIGKYTTETKTGVQIRYDDVNDIELSRTKDRTITMSQLMLGDVNELNVGAFYAQTLELSPKFAITAALRYDYFNNRYFDKLTNVNQAAQSSILSPKLNFQYKINSSAQLYFNNGRGFHSNDTRVAVPQNGKKVLPPAYGSDLGGIFKIGNKIILQSAIWYLWLDQEFIYVGDEGVVEPGGQTQRIGYDLTVRYEIAKGLYADATVSLAKPKALGVADDESFLPLAPTFTSVGGISYKRQKGLNGSLRYRYMGDRAADEMNSVQAKGYFIVDAALNYTTKRFEVGLSLQNILNTKWKETQFLTESRLAGEAEAVEEIHFTPGTPFFGRLHFSLYF